jgi:YVTN family beta-propeller protein
MPLRHFPGLNLLTALAVLLLPAWAIAANPVYVPLGDANRIARIDGSGTRIDKLFEVPDNPHGLAISPDGRTLYAASLLEQVATAEPKAERPQGVAEAEHTTHHGGMAAMPSATPRSYSFITRMDAASGEIARRIDVEKFTHHVTVTPDGSRVIGVQSGAGRIVVIDTATNTVLRYVPVGPAPNYALVTRDGARVFVSSAGSNAVTVMDGKTWRKLATIPVGGAPEHLAFSPDENRLYVANVGSNELSIVDTEALTEMRRVATGREPHGVAYSRTAQAVVVANKGEDTLSVFDPAGELVQIVPLAPQPYHVAADDGGERLWVSSRQEGRQWLVSARDFTVSGALEIPGIGHQIAMAP